MKFSKVSLAYGERTILKNIDISLSSGEFVFLIWSSGSGKILDVNNRDIYALKSKELLSYRRSIGVIFQDFKLLPRKTVRENVAFAMEVCGYDSATISKRVPEVLGQVGLLTKKEKFIESLSGGELQRTAIARALIHNPDIIIGDEPTGNLDPKNAEEIISLLEKLHKEGKTIIISTHDDRLVNRMKQRVITFANGGVVSDIPVWIYNI